jgi:diacylglycerol kinase family enzyme
MNKGFMKRSPKRLRESVRMRIRLPDEPDENGERKPIFEIDPAYANRSKRVDHSSVVAVQRRKDSNNDSKDDDDDDEREDVEEKEVQLDLEEKEGEVSNSNEDDDESVSSEGDSNSESDASSADRADKVESKEVEENDAEDDDDELDEAALTAEIKSLTDLSADHRPMLVFCNSRSGGQQGVSLLHKLRSLLNERQVFELIADGGPNAGFEAFRKYRGRMAVLVCGGDGSVAWVLGALDRMGISGHLYPPMGVLPLGTGNDLARVLGWGGGYAGERLDRLLALYSRAEEVILDRWKVTIEREPADDDDDDDDSAGAEAEQYVFNNYFSIGIDAKIALNFHQAREANPNKFKSRGGNKMYYGMLGAKAMGRGEPVNRAITVEVADENGQFVILDVANKVCAFIVQNIPSYAGGTDLWTQKRSRRFAPQTQDDGKVEIIGVKGSFHMGRIAAKMSSGIRLAQTSRLRITHSQPIAAQVDGEPWLLRPGTMIIELLNRVPVLKRVKRSGGRRLFSNGEQQSLSASAPGSGETSNPALGRATTFPPSDDNVTDGSAAASSSSAAGGKGKQKKSAKRTKSIH